jgi:hypothetical protein
LTSIKAQAPCPAGLIKVNIQNTPQQFTLSAEVPTGMQGVISIPILADIYQKLPAMEPLFLPMTNTSTPYHG